jgi:hypothetical protein
VVSRTSPADSGISGRAIADRRYGGDVESLEPVTVDLEMAEAEIRRRWFVWTAAGLTVHPVTGRDQPRSMGLHISRPSAHVDIVLHRDGWTEVAVLRPDADAVIRATAQVQSVAAFGALVDRSVELITWSGVPKSDGPPAQTAPLPERAAHWVLGYDGQGWSKGS